MKLLEAALRKDVRQAALALAPLMPEGGKWRYDEKPLVTGGRTLESYSYYLPRTHQATCRIFVSHEYFKPELNSVRVLISNEHMDSRDNMTRFMVEVMNALDSVGEVSYSGEPGGWHAWNVKVPE